MKKYHIKQNIGMAKYAVNFHDGNKKHFDGSEFYDIRLFSNKKKLQKFINTLKKNGYKEKMS